MQGFEMIKYNVEVHSDGSIHWYFNGLRHCEHGPAYIDDGGYSYYINGRLHNENGPASVHPHKQGWYLEGLEYTEEKFNAEMKRRRKLESSCDGKVVEIEGKKYRLTEI